MCGKLELWPGYRLKNLSGNSGPSGTLSRCWSDGMNRKNYWKYTSRPKDLLIPSPTRKVPSSIAKCQVHALLMGGQACILFGGSELIR